MSEYAGRYYRPSGRIPFLGTAAMLVFGTLAALVVSFIYALIARYNPFIYIQFFVAIGFGAAMGITITYVSHLTKVRNRTFAECISLLIGLLGLYFAWVWSIYILSGWNSAALVFDPLVTWSIIQKLSEVGLWTLKGAKPTGSVLYGFWTLEALIVLFVCYATSPDMETPFCEECNCWTDKQEALTVGKTDVAKLKEALEQEQYEIVPQLKATKLDPQDHFLVACYTCPNCEDSGYITVSSMKVVMGKDGPENVSATIIPAMAVPHSVTEEVSQLVKQAVAKLPLPQPEQPDNAAS